MSPALAQLVERGGDTGSGEGSSGGGEKCGRCGAAFTCGVITKSAACSLLLARFGRCGFLGFNFLVVARVAVQTLEAFALRSAFVAFAHDVIPCKNE